MKDILLDTNVYGTIIEKKEQELVNEGLKKKKGITINFINYNEFRRLLT